MNRELLKGHLPLMILGLLAEKPMHGYALAKEIECRGQRNLNLGEGTLYPLLYRLERQRLLRASWDKAKPGKPKKIYRLTADGRKKLKSGRKEWRQLTALVQEFLGEDWATT